MTGWGGDLEIRRVEPVMEEFTGPAVLSTVGVVMLWLPDLSADIDRLANAIGIVALIAGTLGAFKLAIDHQRDRTITIKGTGRETPSEDAGATRRIGARARSFATAFGQPRVERASGGPRRRSLVTGTGTLQST